MTPHTQTGLQDAYRELRWLWGLLVVFCVSLVLWIGVGRVYE